MRYASLFSVTVLTVILAVSLVSPVTAVGYVVIKKATTNGDTTTVFHFKATNPDGSVHTFDLAGTGSESSTGVVPPGVYTVLEDVPPGWVLTNVYCEGFIMVPNPSTFTYISGGVIMGYVAGDSVTCVFTNSPISPAVGGVVMPANTLALVAPWLVVVGVVGCIGAIVVCARKRGK